MLNDPWALALIARMADAATLLKPRAETCRCILAQEAACR